MQNSQYDAVISSFPHSSLYTIFVYEDCWENFSYNCPC